MKLLAVLQSYPWGVETAGVRTLPACFLESAALLEVLSVGLLSRGHTSQPLGALMCRMEYTHLRQFSYHFAGISSSAASPFPLVLGRWDFLKVFLT